MESRAHVLVVEDAGIQVRLMELALSRAGFEVTAAWDGREALRCISQRRPDAIILDVEMPGMNGFQVLDVLRTDAFTADIPVLMLTAHAKDSALFEEWARPADAFLTKPFSPAQLIAEVRRALGTLEVTEPVPTAA